MHIGNKARGISLAELLIGIMLLTLVWLSAVGVMIVGRYSFSYSKHKTQAMYVAQRIFEEGRRWPFTDLANGFVTLHTVPVSIDTNGTFDDTADDLMGHSVVTVVPLDATINSPLNYRDRVTVEINWSQRYFGTDKTVREYFTTDITSEGVLN